VRDYASGTLISAYGEWVLWFGCDAKATCRIHLGNATDPDVRTVTLPGLTNIYDMMGYGSGLVAPDGRHAVLPGLESGPALVDLDTGEILQPRVGQWSGGYVWSPDSRWLFQYTGPGAIQAVSTADGHAVDLLSQMPGTTTGAAALAVG
jgi:hypothetical protein